MTYVEEFYKKRRVNKKLERIYISSLLTGLALFFIGGIIAMNIDLEILGYWIVVFGIVLIGISLVIYINAVTLIKKTYGIIEEE